MAISLLEMGKTKKRGVRVSIIFIISKEHPISIKKIYNKIKREYNINVTYQAVFKTIKEMLEESILKKSEKEYELNIEWIKELENELDIIKKSYLKDETIKEPIQSRINDFVIDVGPKIKQYIGKDEAVIIAVSGGGKLFAMALLKYLLKEGLNVKYNEINWLQIPVNLPILKKYDVENKKIILVDSEIYSGITYKIIMEKINKIKKRFNIIDIKYIADSDILGIADFSRTNN